MKYILFRCVKDGVLFALGCPHAIHQIGAAMTSWIWVRTSSKESSELPLELNAMRGVKGRTYEDIFRQHLV